MVLSFNKTAKKSKKIIHDSEFGQIEIRRVRSNSISLRPATNGRLIAHLPYFVPVREVTNLINQRRSELRHSLKSNNNRKTFNDGDQIGKSHHLKITIGPREAIHLKDLTINITIRSDTNESDRKQLIRDGVAKALRKEAKAYLPRRLYFLSVRTGLHYERVQFTHAKSRWGSCSSTGTISLNIMLMTLPQELIDYVLLHELTHTIHMDHSPAFWRSMESICENAKQKKCQLKDFSPYL